eukprot:TRINITY_DN4606_c0_g1_i8.p1 TRINITY_DN4606_c0_g1~~TRINITY_DN4606_c0_g1_i8.p1  ORF type:complete len:414 (-),score=75.81 TRINITY_DN4606_c0_g1_i8:1382-2623(-)
MKCVIYTGDEDNGTEGANILERVRSRFGIQISHDDVQFVFLKKRYWIEATRYPRFTMLGQSLGSAVLAWEALTAFTPHVVFDSMGHAFSYPVFKILGGCRVGSYTHYPTISTDMLGRVTSASTSYNNSASVARNPLLTFAKVTYYRLFARLYGLVGRLAEVVMVNSTWTQNHINDIWGIPDRTHIVYPPCDTDSLQKYSLDADRENFIMSVGQFRPEKDHSLQIRSFASLLTRLSKSRARSMSRLAEQVTLVLCGSARHEEDIARVDELKRLSAELGIAERVRFELNVSYARRNDLFRSAAVGIHTMWCEHFGIGIVELMAAGVVVIAHNSGGPKSDIVCDDDDEGRTGYLAVTEEEYASCLESALVAKNGGGESDLLQLRHRARVSCKRFSDEAFDQAFADIFENTFGLSLL